MGYSTEFDGVFRVSPALKTEHADYLRAFAETRRMRRDPKIAATLPDPKREAVGLPIGDEGGYFVGGCGFAGQGDDASVLDHNCPPSGQPGLWCKWTATQDGTAIVWNEMENFYSYTEWLVYLIDHFLRPWGYTLNGEVQWQGDEPSDMGIIYTRDNCVEAVPSRITNPGPSWA